MNNIAFNLYPFNLMKFHTYKKASVKSITFFLFFKRFFFFLVFFVINIIIS